MSHRSNLRRGDAFWVPFGRDYSYRLVNPDVPMNRQQRRGLKKKIEYTDSLAGSILLPTVKK